MKQNKKGQIEWKAKTNNDLSKRGQIGETMTWIIATIVIIVVLAISIFIASASLEKIKKIQGSYFQTADVLASKSMFSYLATQDSSGKTIHMQLKDEGNLNEFNGNFGIQVFRGLYQKEYLDNPSNVWLGIVVNTEEKVNGESCLNEKQFCVLDSVGNNYFGQRPLGSRGTELSYHSIPYTSESVQLDDKKRIELNLIGK